MTQPASAGLLCPVCKVDLVMTERKDVEIDYCPKCRGVWLDRGELDKIIEKSAAHEAQQRPATPQPQAEPHPQQPHPQAQPYPQQHPGYAGYGERGEYGERDEYGERGERGYYGRRRKSWLEEIFD
jgi:Zn-finger nucleic acid-binding protein